MPAPLGYARALPGTEEPESGPIYRSIHSAPSPIPAAAAAAEKEEGGATDRDGHAASNPLAGLTLPYAESVLHNFAQSVRQFADLPCLGTWHADADGGSGGGGGSFAFVSYAETGARVARVARGLSQLSLLPRVPGPGAFGEPEGERMVGIYMKNSADWFVCEQAAYAGGALVVALYDSLGADATRFILRQTQLATVVCSRLELRRLAAVARGDTDRDGGGSSDRGERAEAGVATLANVVLAGERDAEAEAEAAAAGLRVLHLVDDVEAAGETGAEPATASASASTAAMDLLSLRPPRARDVASIMYTSGTTGEPKGAVLTHAAVMSACAAVLHYVSTSGRAFSSDTAYLSFLPLAHIYERSAQVALVAAGARIGFSRGDPRLLLADVSALRPTVFCAVPRVLNRLYDGIAAKARAPPPGEDAGAGAALRAKLLSAGLRAKLRRLARTGQHEHAFWDRVLFRRVRQQLGLDRCWLILSGSAPLAPEVLQLLRVALVCLVAEGYGQTETCGGVTGAAFADAAAAGFVGAPHVGAEVKLASVPDMRYLVSDRTHDDGHGPPAPCLGRGEICVRGPLLFSGYYKQPERTREAVDADGWLHTGDIGLWSPLGQLRIVDRKKNLFKLSQGEYVAPDKVENALAVCPTVAQVFVTGDSLRSHLVAVVVPDEPALVALAKAHGFAHLAAAAPAAGERLRLLCEQKPLRELVLREIDAAGARARLAGFERVRAVHLHHEPFSVDNGLLTPTFKLRRADAQRAFRAHIDALYRESGDRVAGQ